MTTSARRPVDPRRLATVRALADQLPASCASSTRSRRRYAEGGRDRAALVLLFPLDRLGPLRQGALADAVHADPSTVSRHVALARRAGTGAARGRRVRRPGEPARRHRRRPRRARRAARASARPPADASPPTGPPTTSRPSPTLFGRLLDDIAATLPGVPDGRAPPPTFRERSDEPEHRPHQLGRAAGRPCGGRRAGRQRRLHAPPDRHDPRRADARHVPGGAGPDRRLDGDPRHRRRPAGLRPAGLGDDGVPHHLDDHHAAVRQAVGPLRAPAVLPVRDRRLRRRLHALRARRLDVPARRLPGDSRASAPAA